MDGLSAASGVIAIASLAIQLVDSVNRLHEFVGSLKEAPKEIESIEASLLVVSSILDDIRRENPETTQDAVLTAALVECGQYVGALNSIAEDLVPGFTAASPLGRTWTAVRAVKKGDKIRKFQERLEQAKTTLIMARQESARRLQLEHHESQQQALSDITYALENLQAQTSYQSEVISAYYTNRDDYLGDVFQEIRRVSSSWANPLMRAQLEKKLREAVESTLDSLPEKQDLAKSETELEGDEKSETPTGAPLYSAVSRPWKRKLVARAGSSLSSIFGQIHCSSQAYRILRSGYVTSLNKANSHQRRDYIVESSFWLVPSAWLVKFGIAYAVHVQVTRSSHAGWNHVLKSFNLAPDAALIFDFCQSGNIDGVRTLFSKGLASVRDVNSEGVTPLHIAAANYHPQLCDLLIREGADRSATKWPGWEHAVYTPDQDYSLIGVQKEHRQIETFRVFLSAGEEIDDEDSSMDLQLSSFCDRELINQGVVKESDFVYPSVWLLEQVLSTAKQSTFDFGYEWWLWRLTDAMLKTPNRKPFVEVLKHCSTAVIQAAMIHWVWLLDFPDRDDVQRTELTEFERMYEKVGHLHFKAKCLHSDIEDKDTSPLAMAMQKSQSFSRFRTILKKLDIDIETFVHEEAEYLEDGWTEESLLALFMDDYQPILHRGLSCVWCRREQLWVTLGHPESLWEQRMERIKAGKDPAGPFSEDEIRVQQEWDAYISRFVDQGVCAQCQRQGRSIKIQDDSVASVVKLGLTTPLENLE